MSIDTENLTRCFAEHVASSQAGSVFYIIVVHPDGRIGGTCAVLCSMTPEGVPHPQQDTAQVLGRAVEELVSLTVDLTSPPEEPDIDSESES